MSNIQSIIGDKRLSLTHGYVMRKATPIDAPYIAELVDIACEQEMLTALASARNYPVNDPNIARKLAIADVESSISHMSWTNVILVEKDGIPAAAAVMFNPNDLKNEGFSSSPEGFEILDVLTNRAAERHGNFLYLAYLAVFEEHRGRNLSRYLLNQFTKEQIDRGLEIRAIASLESNKRANRIYRKAGFEERDRLDHFADMGPMCFLENCDYL